MLEKIFKIVSFYDQIRWSSVSNYNLINFYINNLNEDAKLLTHWICYISDRQMSFERIWEVGGFVYSELVDQFKENGDLGLLNPHDADSFIHPNDKQGYSFNSKSKVNNNSILKLSYGLNETDSLKFTPRYYPSDYFSILYTLDILKKYDLSFTKYIVTQLNNFHGKEDYIRRLLFSLYLLTYFEVGQPKKADIEDFQENLRKTEKRTKKVISILNDESKFDEEFYFFEKDSIYNQKRSMCSLRDFFKSPEFNHYFRNTLTGENFSLKKQSELFSLKSLQQFELPGDVWNNNSKFRNCIFENTEYANKKKSLNKILREFYDKNRDKLNNCYPEQFDITFDFVPRMCESNNCDICPINFAKGSKESNFKKTCVEDEKLFCPVVLTNCNYKVKCYGIKCELLKHLK